MAMTFGWVVQPTPSAGTAGRDLLAYNRESIGALGPGFTTIWMEDHFQRNDRPVLEAWTTMTALAVEFPRFTFGPIVLGQSYRNPALTAKMAATLHYLTGGRTIMGIGAGWKEDEYRAYGYDYPRPSVRIGQLEDTIQIMRALWTQSPATYRGAYYAIENAYCEPRPQPLIPIHVGGGGERKTLRVVAQHADAWNGNFMTRDDFARKLEVLRDHCQAVGRDFGTLGLTFYTIAHLPADPAEFRPRPEMTVFGPTPADAIRQLRDFAALGVSHVLIRSVDLATLRRFSAEVAPALA